MLIYLVLQRPDWEVVENSNNMVSKYIVKILYNMPCINLCITLLIISYLLVILKPNKYSIIMQIVSSYLIYIGCITSINILALENISPFTFFSIVHPIAIEAKIAYLNTEIAHYTFFYFPRYLKVKKLYSTLIKKYKHIL